MSVKAGVWIDHKQAVLVLISETGSQTKKFTSGIKRTDRTGSKTSYTPKDFVPEDRLQRKSDSHLKEFYDEVIAGLQGSDSLLILGPGEAKGELQKRLKSKKVRGVAVTVETADKLTDRQVAAKVAEHFALAPARKSTSSKKSVKKAAKTKTAKPAVKTKPAAKKK